MECPFHPLRDIFGPQQAAKKQNRPSQFECGFCGKSFFEEKFLDLHFETRHKNNINMVRTSLFLNTTLPQFLFVLYFLLQLKRQRTQFAWQTTVT